MSALVCDPCAAGTFPEFSVNPATEIVFRYGDDGPAAALEISLEIPSLRADFLPLGAFLLPSGESNGGVSVESEGLELSYTRSARRRGGLAASLGSVVVTDLSPGTAFPRLVAPGTEMKRNNASKDAHDKRR